MIQQNFISEWNHQFSQKIHKAKLKNIMSREPKGLNTSLETVSTIRKIESERFKKIHRENKILYDRLLFISERKSSPLLFSSVSPSKTCPNRYKKLEAARINMENIKLINRLTNNNSALSLKKMLKDYKQNEEYRDRISRKNLQERIKKAVTSTIKQVVRPKAEDPTPTSDPIP